MAGLRIKLGGGNKRGIGGKHAKPVSFVGKLLGTVFLSIFIAVGVFFATMMFDQTDRAIDQQAWIERPGKVLSSGIDIDPSSNEPYTPRVEYNYTHGGRTYTSSAISSSDPATNDYRDAQAYTLNYPPGATATVYVNPNQPSEALLDTGGIESLGTLLFGIVFLCLFSGIPLTIIIGMWWPKRGGNSEQDQRAQAARARGKRSTGGLIGGLIFGGVFAAAGIGMLIFMTILPLWRTASAQAWSQVPCVVERSELLRFEGDDGPTYRIDILYRYEIEGQSYGSNRYSFSSFGSSSGQTGKQKTISQYPVGKQTTCYVDPADPTQAVLHRGLSLANLWGLFPIPFAAVGLGVIYFTLFGKGKDKTNNWRPEPGNKAGDAGAAPSQAKDPATDPIILDPSASRKKSFVGAAFFALIWNGITGAILYFFLGDFLQGDWETAPVVFFCIFQVIGLIIIGVAIHKLMLLFAPRVVLQLSRQAIPIGGSAELGWLIPGTSRRITKLTIQLIGEESATYTRGTDTVTDTETFYEHDLVADASQGGQEDPHRAAANDAYGEVMLTIPLETMHSFEAEHNKIVWKLRVKAEVPRFPDPKDEYPLTVLPMPIDGAGSRA